MQLLIEGFTKPDHSFLENWHPISLLNFDTKIMFKVIASRIKRYYLILFIIIRQVTLKITL